jgi:molybdenum cofactor cytidylyltransferase
MRNEVGELRQDRAPRGPVAGPVAGILLAAGTSSRMGGNKLLLEIQSETLLRRSARRGLEAGLEPLVVVLGHESERARAELDGLGCLPVENPDYAQGVTSSLRAGLRALPADTPATVVLLADMPFVTAEMIAALVERYRATAAPVVVSSYEGVDAPPMLYDRILFGELAAMGSGATGTAGAGGGCGRQVVKRHRHEAEVLSWPAAALADCDLPEDYRRARAASGE